MVKPLQFTCSEMGTKRETSGYSSPTAATQPLFSPRQISQDVLAWGVEAALAAWHPLSSKIYPTALSVNRRKLLSELLSAWLPAELQWRARREHAMGLG